MKFKIYKHTSPSGKVYIGQTSQDNVIERWRNGGKGYFRINKFGEYQQPAMVNAIKKYSWEDWKHEIIEECNTQEEANYLEEKYIEEYKSYNPNFGYNITKGGGGHSGQTMSEKTKEKLSQSIKEKWEDPEYRNKVIQSQKDLWKNPEFKKNYMENTLPKIIAHNIGKSLTQETKDKISKAHSISVIQFSLSGEMIAEHESALKAANSIGKTVTSITNQCKNITKKCGNFLFMFKDDYEQHPEKIIDKVANLNKPKLGKPILQLTLNEELIQEWVSSTEASRILGISVKSINNCLKGRTNSAGKFKWKYKNAN